MLKEYKVDVRPPHERKDIITTLSEKPLGTHTTFDVYEGTRTTLPVIRLPLDVPVYRMANARTQTEQLVYLTEKKLAPDYFLTGQENETAQQAQHEILRKFAREGTESIIPIIDELERTKQTDPIMLTPAGIVVNGNRRLAAMRELYAERQADFPTFAEVECMILPSLTEDQIDDIETRLQERPETKLPYSWINEILKIKRQLAQKGKKEEDIANIRRKKVGDIRKAISALNYAEIYLKDWRKSPSDYRLVEQGEQFFNDLVSRLKNKDGPLLEANLRMAWILFDNRTGLGGRIYEFNRVLGEKAPTVLAQLAERMDIDTGPADGVAEPEEEEFEIDLGETASAGDGYAPLIAVLGDAARRDEVFDELRAVCQTILDTGQAAKTGRAALRAAQDANTRLAEIDLTDSDPKTHDGIDKQLEEIINRANGLRTKLKKIKEGPKEAEAAGEKP